MLAQMTSTQYEELRAFFRLESTEKERQEDEVQESRLKQFFANARARQARGAA